jgi:ABC-2 type transport system permease protein
MKAKKYLTTFRISLRNALYYKKSVLGSIIMYSLFVYVFFLLWSAVYSGRELSGYSFRQMIWYFCTTEFIAMSMGGGIFYQMGQDIKNGAIAYQLGRPYSYIWYQFANTMGTVAVRLVMFAVLAGVLGTLLVGAPSFVTLVSAAFFLLSVVLALIVQFFALVSIGLTAFFVEENRPFFFIYSKLVLVLGTFLPIEFFPQWMQNILRYMPFSLITWGPAKMFVDFSYSHALHTLTALTFWAAAMMVCAFGVFQRGVKKIHVHGG